MAIKRKGKLPLIKTDSIDEKMFKFMRRVGVIGVKWAIQNHEFSNVTHNLEDSYGFAIYKGGAMIGEPFTFNKNATETKDGESGHTEAIKFLSSYNPSTDGWSLVVVAGMSYASFVEFMYGLDVLQGSEMVAKQAFDKQIRKIKWTSR